MSICQCLPDPYEGKVLTFQKHVIYLQEDNNFLMGQIRNGDQTLVFFDMPADSTIYAVEDKEHSCLYLCL